MPAAPPVMIAVFPSQSARPISASLVVGFVILRHTLFLLSVLLECLGVVTHEPLTSVDLYLTATGSDFFKKHREQFLL